ncbi:MAG: tyrosine-type recombinase/integrase, partial [Candidatus Hydrogenedentes bacterium]|nr:tyrosine-type recombinase/integrase [Candidatus Hydrogenedentota bacterium]
MILLHACESLYFPRSLSIRSEETRRQYRLAIADFGKTLERVPDVTDLTDDNLALLYRWLLDVRKVCIVTANERVGRLKALGDFLWKRGYIPHGITLGRMRAPRRTPCAWQRDEIRRLLIACRNFKGHLGGVPACAWWRAHLAWLWATGARVGETLALRWEWIDFTHKVAHVPAEVRKGQSGD